MNVTAYTRDADGGGTAQPIAGPADLYRFGPGVVIVVRGDVEPADATRWSAAVGAAVIRGARAERRP